MTPRISACVSGCRLRSFRAGCSTTDKTAGRHLLPNTHLVGTTFYRHSPVGSLRTATSVFQRLVGVVGRRLGPEGRRDDAGRVSIDVFGPVWGPSSGTVGHFMFSVAPHWCAHISRSSSTSSTLRTHDTTASNILNGWSTLFVWVVLHYDPYAGRHPR